MYDIQKKCKDCVYFKRSFGCSGEWMCHYLLETDKRRVVGEDGKCKSKAVAKGR